MSADPIERRRAHKPTALARRLWTRRPETPFRFVFTRDPSPRLTLEPLTERGTASFREAAREARAGASPGSVVDGAALVDDNGALVFVTTRATDGLLEDLAAFAQANRLAEPALASLVDAGCAVADFDLDDEETMNGLQLRQLEITRDPALWHPLTAPTVETLARALQHASPGSRLWFWLSDDPDHGPRLILQPFDDDPRRDRLRTLVQHASNGPSEPGTDGVVIVDAHGTLQFVSDGLEAAHLHLLAQLTHRHAADHPLLRRLVRSRLLRTDGSGTVVQRIDEPEPWSPLTAPVVPGTLGETAQILDTLAIDTAAWFWFAPAGPVGPFLSLIPTADDPDCTAFTERLAWLGRRLGTHAVAGTVRRLTSGELLFTSPWPVPGSWGDAIRRLVDTHAETWPALCQLLGATLVRTDGTRIVRALSTRGTP